MRRADRPYDPSRPDGGPWRLKEELPFVYWMVVGLIGASVISALSLVSKLYYPDSSFAAFISEVVQEMLLWIGGGALLILGLLLLAGFVSQHTPLSMQLFESNVLNNRFVGVSVGAAVGIVAVAWINDAVEQLTPVPAPEPKTAVEQAQDQAVGALERVKSWWSK